MRILVVDDDYVSRTKLVGLLSPYGQCDSAPNGEIAIQIFEAAHKELAAYDLVTMDIEMPVMDGFQTVHAIRRIEQILQVKREKETRILMVTAKRSPHDIMSSYAEGCNGYLTKAFNAQDVKRALELLGFKEQ